MLEVLERSVKACRCCMSMQAATAFGWHACRIGQAGHRSCLAMGCLQAMELLGSEAGLAARVQHPAVLLRGNVQLQQTCRSSLARHQLWQGHRRR